MSEETIRSRVRSFIEKRFPAAAAKAIQDQDHLLVSGVVDSLGVLELVGYLDSEFGIQVEDDDLSPENFASIQSISTFIVQKRSG